ncbi:MAG: hypothetical protein HY905_25930 [Deltaproteobacteria bacterium]|nr:hypothetical protein [Deltaproteobacteria bacterium]
MAYYVDIFSPATYATFGATDRTVSGFRPRQRAAAIRVQPGDKLLCYLTSLSRWVGLLLVESRPFDSRDPIFAPENDPFVVRLKVRPMAWLSPEHAIPIHTAEVWTRLSFTREASQSDALWTGQVRASLNRMGDEDGQFLESLILEQARSARAYPLTERDERRLRLMSVRRPDGDVAVTVPESDSEEDDEAEGPSPEPTGASAIRESIRMQAVLAIIGKTMGFKIWVPAGDRSRVLDVSPALAPDLLARLPMNYDETTLQTIQNIDLLWIQGRSIRRAFEIEHTTAIYSGLLRMADLLALQPNTHIPLHIVAPEVRKDKVFQEISRPVFSLLERGPLSKTCSFLSYDAVLELSGLDHLAHLSDSVLREYEEFAE